MKNKKIKTFSFMGGLPTDVKNGMVDVFVTLEGDNFEYWVEIATPQAFSSHMEKNNENFIEPGANYIIVRELTSAVIREALEAYVAEKEDAFWLKWHHLTVEWNINDLNTVLDRQEKRLKAEEDEDRREEENETSLPKID